MAPCDPGSSGTGRSRGPGTSNRFAATRTREPALAAARRLREGFFGGPDKGGAMTEDRTDETILERITKLVAEEHALWSGDAKASGALKRLEDLRIELDQCWDLLRQRRARREFGQDPDDAAPRAPRSSRGTNNSRERRLRAMKTEPTTAPTASSIPTCSGASGARPTARTSDRPAGRLPRNIAPGHRGSSVPQATGCSKSRAVRAARPLLRA